MKKIHKIIKIYINLKNLIIASFVGFLLYCPVVTYNFILTYKM